MKINNIFEMNRESRKIINNLDLKLNELILLIEMKLMDKSLNNKMIIFIEYINITGENVYNKLKNRFKELKIRIINKDTPNQCCQIDLVTV
jgi:hypothetical protein